MHSNHGRSRRRQDASRSPVRDRERSPVLLPRGHNPDVDQPGRSSYSHSRNQQTDRPAQVSRNSHTQQQRRKHHQTDIQPPSYPATSSRRREERRDDRRDDRYAQPSAVDAYAGQRHDSYYDRSESQWLSSSHYQDEWNSRPENYGSYHDERHGWMPPPTYDNGPRDRWPPSDRPAPRYDPPEHTFSRDVRRHERQQWPVEEGWSDRKADPVNNWQPVANASTAWSPRRQAAEREQHDEDRRWQPGPNWQEHMRHDSSATRSRHDHENRKDSVYRDDRADIDSRQSRQRTQRGRSTKQAKRQRSPSPVPSRSRSRSRHSPSPVRSRSPKRRRHEKDSAAESRDYRERQRRRSHSRDTYSSHLSDSREYSKHRKRSLSPASSRSPSPPPAPRTLHRLPGPSTLRTVNNNDANGRANHSPDKRAGVNGQSNGKRRTRPQQRPRMDGAETSNPGPTTAPYPSNNRRGEHIMDQDYPEPPRNNGTVRSNTSPSRNRPSNAVQQFFPGDEDDRKISPPSASRRPSPEQSESRQRPTPSRDPLPVNAGRRDDRPVRSTPDPRRLSRQLSPHSEPRVPHPLPPRPRTPPESPKSNDQAQVSTDGHSGDVTSVRTPTEMFKVVSKVGEGTFGQVYKAGNGAGGFVALKRIRMESERDGFPITAMREIRLLQSLSHVNVVKLHEMMVAKGGVYMVFEYMDHDLTGVLYQRQFIFTPAHIKALCKQMFAGLAYLHHKGVIHRDLKGSNILLNNRGELKLADFGLARFYHKRRHADYTNRVITQWYRPPELLLGATVYGPEVDVWSAGCIMLELFTRRAVFQADDEIHQLQVIYRVMGTPNMTDWPELVEQPWYELVKPKEVVTSQFRESFSRWLSPAALDLAEGLLTYNPKRRTTAAQALEAAYFLTEQPPAEMPTGLSTLVGEWHELDSKKERAERAKQKRRVVEDVDVIAKD